MTLTKRKQWRETGGSPILSKRLREPRDLSEKCQEGFLYMRKDLPRKRDSYLSKRAWTHPEGEMDQFNHRQADRLGNSGSGSSSGPLQ